MPENSRRERSYPHCGRIVVLSSRSQTDTAGRTSNEQDESIEFPAMPDSIELARTAVYNVTPNFVMPDGIHMYKHTEPLQIPFSFTLHSFDSEYCQFGALSLLRLAAKLHALVLPIGDSSKSVRTQVVAATKPGAATESATEAKASGQSTSSAVVGSYEHTSPPVTCRLEMLYTSEGNPGIVCIGYVKDVKAVLRGPFMRGPGRSYNLPSAGEFSFTFVHRPGHYNNLSSEGARSRAEAAEPQAYADHVLKNFYSTSMMARSKRGFRGFFDSK